VSFSQAYYTKNKKCAMQKHNASLLDILRGSIIIPGELLSSRAHFRLMNSEAKLNRNLYIYKIKSEFVYLQPVQNKGGLRMAVIKNQP
jgi:hypothetical protein